ncbi:MAG: serpin family protein, partial [Candidatus Diapherotrites archaeon]|nr:serpin family protein [Candidatus Diapherotrites archaeon]
MQKQNINLRILNLGIITILAIVVVLVLFGCTVPSPNPTPNLNDSGATTENVQALVNGQNTFAFNLYENLKNNPENSGKNVFLSPYSISTALSMVYEGARGTTAEEMQKTLLLPIDSNQRFFATARLYNQLNKTEKQYILNTANALWTQKDFTFLESYLSTVKNYYGGSAINVDFINDGSMAVRKINEWAAQSTNNRIPKVLDEKMDTSMLRLVLTNAIYFKGKWENEFKKENTVPQTFYKTDGGTIQTQFMHQQEHLQYSDNNYYELLELPYKGNELSMIIVLPKNDAPLEKKQIISGGEVQDLVNNVRTETVNVALPKFTFKTHYNLNAPLQELGIKTAFTDAADLSGMDGKRDLEISFVLHDTFVEVNEEGTEAAAVTTIGVATSAMRMPENIIDFVADHPFLFIIRDNATGAF